MYLLTGNKNECCGCTACQAVCAINAISMQTDDEGFLFPIKDESLCTHCGLCEKVCAFDNPNYGSVSPKVFAALHKEDAEIIKSTSGGIFYALAQKVIANGGIVYGAVMDDSFQVYHKGAESVDEIERFRGSKYVQSDMKDCYREIKYKLQAGRDVYFTGTPCQVAGLKAFLRRGYSNLYTSDVVCHGVPNQKLLDAHIDYLKEKYHAVELLSPLKFRDYETGGGCEIFNFTNRNGKNITVKQPTYELSPYLYSFMYAYTYRYSCYYCPFAKIPRQGDVTLADFWGVKNYHPQLDNSKGISLILVNNDKGQMMWNSILNDIYFWESDLEKASAQNKNLVRPTEMPPIRKEIFNLISDNGYSRIARTKFRSPRYNRIKMKIFLRNIIGNNGVKIYHKIKGMR